MRPLTAFALLLAIICLCTSCKKQYICGCWGGTATDTLYFDINARGSTKAGDDCQKMASGKIADDYFEKCKLYTPPKQ